MVGLIFLSMYLMQMQAERSNLAEERKERAQDRMTMHQMFATIASGFTRKKGKHRHRNREEESSSSEDSSSSSSR